MIKILTGVANNYTTIESLDIELTANFNRVVYREVVGFVPPLHIMNDLIQKGESPFTSIILLHSRQIDSSSSL